MKKRYLAPYLIPALVLTIIALAPLPVRAQFTIQGNTCVMPGSWIGPYDIIGPWVSTDKWCVSSGTLGGTSNSCIANGGSPSVGVTWGNGPTATLSYYHPGTATTPVATLTVNIIMGGQLTPGAVFVPSGMQTTINITGPAGSGCAPGAYNYGWLTGPNMTSGTPIGGNTQNLTVTGTWTTGTLIWRTLNNSNVQGSANSQPVSIVPEPPFNPGAISPTPQSIWSGTAPTALSGTAASGGNFGPTYNYLWQISSDGVNWTPISGATGLNYTPGNLSATTYYERAVTNGPLTMYSNIVTVTVMNTLVPGAVTPASSNCIYNASPPPLSITGTSGGNGAYTYQWEYSLNNAAPWTPISGALSPGYTPLNVTTTTYYHALVTSSGITLPSISGVVVPTNGVPPADNPTGNANINMNWLISSGYDASGNLLGQSKTFYDNAGQAIQSQQKVFYRSSPSTVLTHVLASETIRDAENRDVLTTLPAPINYADFSYMPNFAQASDGSNYTYKNFDRFNPSGSSETDLTNSPQGVGGASAKGTLGWYYGSNNTWEPYTPTSGFPYSRKSIYKDGTNNDKKEAASGEAFVMGSNHEISNYITPVNGELTNYMQVRNHCFSGSQMGAMPSGLLNNATQTVSRDANGNQTVSIADLGGNPILTGRPGTDMSFTNVFSVAATSAINYSQQIVCNAGSGYSIQVLQGGNNINMYLVNGGTVTSVYSGNASSYPVYSAISGTGTLVIQSDVSFFVTYVVNGSQYSASSTLIAGATLPTVGYFNILADNTAVTITGSYTIYDMNAETTTALNAGQLNKGYYKIVSTSGIVNVSYPSGLTDVSYHFYNHLGQLIASVPPNGVKLLEGTGYTNYSTPPAIPYAETFAYDAQGRQVSMTTPDGGARQFVYRSDGQVRFSQNARQVATGAYSYTNYDALGRSIESGQYQPDAGGISFSSAASIIDNTTPTGGLTTGTKTDVLISTYDIADNTHGQAGYAQDPIYVGGVASTTKRYSSILNNTPSAANLVSETWYNYDESGQIVWMIKYNPALGAAGYKMVDFTYDAMNRLVKRVFQKNTPSETFVHYYQYDAANGNLQYIYTNTVDNPATMTLQAKYIYYLHGGVKRIELGTHLQGIDYTYTLEGSLKAINNSNNGADPGNDAAGINGFNADAFGETLDYYANDYVNTRTSGIQPIHTLNTSGVAADSYTGNIKAMSWYSLKPPGTGGSSSPTTYAYNYDPKYQLTGSTWGTGLNFAANPTTFNSTGNYKESVAVPGTGAPAYDGNGNIQYLQRSGSTGATTDQFAYTYTPNTNMLASVTNTGTPAGTFTYTYDATGREISENDAGVTRYLRYDVTGKVTLVANDAAFTQPIVGFVYDETGQKIEKLSYNSSYQLSQVTYYYWDVVYTQTVIGGVYGSLTPQEYSIPGATGRLGTYFKQSNSYAYQLTDHLGNVRAVIIQTGAIQTAQDYYPFGMSLAALGNASRYGYQGQNSEADPETGWNNFQLRMYNSRIGRWLITDPDDQFDNPYEGMGNDPVSGTDADGGWDWFGHQNADGSVSLIDLVGVHNDMLNIVGESWVNLGEDNIGESNALANGTNYFASFQTYFGNFHSLPFDVIENWKETNIYSNRAQFSSVGSGPRTTTWSPSNDRKIAQLDQRMQQPVTNFINRSQQELGVRIFIAEGYRSIETQARLYAQGRTTPGNIVTYAKPGWSWHQFALAIDVYPTKANGQPNFNATVSPDLVNIATQEGLQWGGNFPKGKVDPPHFQMKFGMTITQVRAIHGL